MEDDVDEVFAGFEGTYVDGCNGCVDYGVSCVRWSAIVFLAVVGEYQYRWLYIIT